MGEKKAADIIIDIMEKENIRPSDLARMMGLDRRTIHQLLHKTQDLKYSKMLEILKILGYEIKITKKEAADKAAI